VSAPTLSIVVTGRNDNYGGDFNERFFTALRFNYERLSERGVACEVVFVEWNPVPDRPHLSDVLAHECPDVAPSLRCYVVAPRYHPALTQNPSIGYLEFVAKNVGVRRASAPFVLVTNTDVFLGREIVDAIATGKVAPGTVYRAARYDIKMGADRSHLAWDALEDPTNHVRRPVLRPPLFTGGSGDFMLAERRIFHDLRGYNEVYRMARAGPDVNFLVKAHGAGVPIADIGGPVYHFNHVGSFRISKSLYGEDLSNTPWGKRWPSRNVVYDNPSGWGLGDAPSRALSDNVTYLDFDWRAVPPLVDLRRVVLPVRHAAAESRDRVGSVPD
jgi:hypothetical protein